MATWTEQDDNGEWYDDCVDVQVDRRKQESYLGYLPKDDKFITGFDMWEGEDNPSGMVKWRYANKKFAILEENINYSHNMVYGKRGLYSELQKKYKKV